MVSSVVYLVGIQARSISIYRIWLGIIYRRSCGKSGLVGKGRVNGPYVFWFSNAKFESSFREPKSIFNSVSIIRRSKICLQHALIRYSTWRRCDFHRRLHFTARAWRPNKQHSHICIELTRSNKLK
jgi:hypothetical protein